MPSTKLWTRRLLTGRAMLALVGNGLRVRLLPFARWRSRYRNLDDEMSPPALSDAQAVTAHDLARIVERASLRLPYSPKCLAQALALGRLLERERIAHRIVIAARPGGSRRPDKLHAWLEAGSNTLIGDLPGPWIVVTRLVPLS
ncbi:lasso peptide biosynthesis B2 protein [Altererythrobacter sp. CAU 1778]